MIMMTTRTLNIMSYRPSMSSRNGNDQTTKTAPALITLVGRAVGARHWSALSRSHLSMKKMMKEESQWCLRLLSSPLGSSPLWTHLLRHSVIGGTERDGTQTSVTLSPEALTGNMRQPIALQQMAQAPPLLHLPSSGLSCSFYYN